VVNEVKSKKKTLGLNESGEKVAGSSRPIRVGGHSLHTDYQVSAFISNMP
jgi:hypothetical protein